MPKSTEAAGGKKQKLKLTNKQFDDLLKELKLEGNLQSGISMDATLMSMLRQATEAKFNEAAVEQFGEIPSDGEGDDDASMEEDQKEPVEQQKDDEKQEEKRDDKKETA